MTGHAAHRLFPISPVFEKATSKGGGLLKGTSEWSRTPLSASRKSGSRLRGDPAGQKIPLPSSSVRRNLLPTGRKYSVSNRSTCPGKTMGAGNSSDQKIVEDRPFNLYDMCRHGPELGAIKRIVELAGIGIIAAVPDDRGMVAGPVRSRRTFWW